MKFLFSCSDCNRTYCRSPLSFSKSDVRIPANFWFNFKRSDPVNVTYLCRARSSVVSWSHTARNGPHGVRHCPHRHDTVKPAAAPAHGSTSTREASTAAQAKAFPDENAWVHHEANIEHHACHDIRLGVRNRKCECFPIDNQKINRQCSRMGWWKSVREFLTLINSNCHLALVDHLMWWFCMIKCQ